MATQPSYEALQQVYGQQQEPSGFMGLLSSPAAQGLLGMGLGALASNGTRAQAIGRGGLLGLSAFSNARGAQENRLLQMAQAKARSDALGALRPGEDGAISATPAQLIAAGFDDPAKWEALRNFGRDKFKQMETVTNPDGSKSLHSVDEYGRVRNTGLSNAPEIKPQDLGGKVSGVNPYTGQEAWSADKTLTHGERETARHNRASEGIQYGNLDVSRSRLEFEKGQAGNGYTFNAEMGGYVPKKPGGQFVPLSGTPNNPKLTESEAKNSLYLGQMREASNVFDRTPSSPVSVAMTDSTYANWAAPKDAQIAGQAQRQWAESYLRAKTGAAATTQEVEGNIRTFFPVVGDSKEVVRRKAEARAAAERDMEVVAGRGASRVGGREREAQARSGGASGSWDSGSTTHVDDLLNKYR